MILLRAFQKHPETCAGYVKQAKVAATLEDASCQKMKNSTRSPNM
jgi:hypothetical protein